MKNNIRKSFTQVPNELINDSSMSRDARFLFVYLCSKPDDWTFYTSKIETDLNCSKDSRIKYMKELIASGWITTEQTKKSNGEWGSMEIVLNPFPKKPDADPQPKKTDTVKTPTPQSSGAEIIGSGQSHPLNNTDEKTNIDLFTNTDEAVAPVSNDVLKYLNETKPSKTPFQMTRSNLKDIEARIKEKFKMSDFKKVIDFKVSQWKDDPKMKKYIRPETLFGSKFNGYLVESESGLNGKGDGSENFQYKPQEKAELL